MSGEAIKAAIRGFLSRSFDTDGLADDADIFALGFVTSLFAMQLVEFLESEFTIAVESEDLEIANFESLRAITGFVERKLSTTQLGGAPAAESTV